MSKNEKGGISPHHVRLILNQVWRGHTTDVQKVIKILQDAGLVGSDDLSLSAAADSYPKIPAEDFGRAMATAGLPIDVRIRVKLEAARAGLIP
jgi:hypothetical protein